MSLDIMTHALKALDSKPSPDVANCDCCDERPGTHMTKFGGMDTWICEECSDITPRRLPSFRTNDERDAYMAGSKAYGEI